MRSASAVPSPWRAGPARGAVTWRAGVSGSGRRPGSLMSGTRAGHATSPTLAGVTGPGHFRSGLTDLTWSPGSAGMAKTSPRTGRRWRSPDRTCLCPGCSRWATRWAGLLAISERHFGLFLEDLDEPRWRRLLPALVRGLDHLRHLQVPAGSQVLSAAGGPAVTMSWREWLLEGLVDRPGQRVAGWRAVLAGIGRPR